MMLKAGSAIALGIVLGFAASRAMFLGWWTLVPWGIAGVALGLGMPRGEAARVGAIYGFVLCFVFTLAGYRGAASWVSRIPFFGLFGLFGALCGLALGLLGSRLKLRSTTA